MRKALLAVLMAATAATPVMAVERGDDGRQRRAESADERPARAEQRQERRTERQQARQEVRTERRVERQQAPVAAQPAQPAQTWQRSQRTEAVRPQRQQPQQQSGQWQGRERSGGGGDAYRRHIEETREASRRSAEGVIPSYQRGAARNQARYEEQLRERRQDRREDRRDWRQDRREDGRDYRQDRRQANSWNRQWRNDRRYDWQNWRSSNRSIFSSSRYYAPYRNHRYSRLSIGLTLGSLFYSNQYWLSDPWQYRLPPAPYGTQWVRYYDDVLLIDVYTGEVVDVIYDFFW